MKQSPQDREFEKNLKPSKFSGDGFLGSDTRSLEEIIGEDQRILEHLGVGKETIVKKLTDLFMLARDGFGNSIALSSELEVQFHESMGRIPSPFRKDGLFEKGEAVVIDIKTQKPLFYITALSINLIEKHDFFQGRGSRYRIEPEDFIRIFALR